MESDSVLKQNKSMRVFQKRLNLQVIVNLDALNLYVVLQHRLKKITNIQNQMEV